MRALLWAAEYDVLEARSGEEALEVIRNCGVLPDLVLLDVTLGGAVSGFEVCLEIRREYSPGELPVVMITCSSLEEDVIRGLAVGANDYLIKPLRNLELMARIKTQLALKRSIRVAAEARVNRSLLGSILPANVIRQLKQGVTLIAQFHQEVTILFSDIRGFTNLATEWPTEQIILMLNNMFTAFDRLCDQMGVYKVETIGDAYMIVSGHDGVEDHAARMLRMAACMLEAVTDMRGFDGRELQIRVGIHTGPAHSGVVGLSRPRYCFFGDTVNTASRMESTGFPMAIQVSESTLRAVTSRPEWAAEFQFVTCGPRDIKGKGTMHTFLLRVGLYDKALAELAAAAAAAAAPKRRAVAEAAAAGGGAAAATAAAATAAAATAAAATAVAETAGNGPAEAAAPPPAAPQSQDGVTAAAAAGPSARRLSACGTLGSTAPAAVNGHWRSQMVAGLAAATAAAEPGGGDLVDMLKYASYRYHHPHMSGVDIVSSAGTSVLVDNGLALLLPSHAMEGSLIDTLDVLQSGAYRLPHAAPSSGGGGGASRAIPGLFSGSMPIAHLPPPSPTRRLAAAAAAAATAGQKAYGSSSSTIAAAAATASARRSVEVCGRGASAAGFWGVAVTSAATSASVAASAIPTGAVDTSGTAGGSSRAGSCGIGADGGAAPYDTRPRAAAAPPPPPAAVQRSRPPSPSLLCASQSPTTAATAVATAVTDGGSGGGGLPSTRTSRDVSSALDEPSLQQYALNPGGGGGAASTATRLLSDVGPIAAAAATAAAAADGLPCARRPNPASLQRSTVRTSAELTAATAAAAAAAAAASNTSADDDANTAAAAAGAAVETSPSPLLGGLDLEGLILAQRSLDVPATRDFSGVATGGGVGSGPGGEGPALPGQMAGWSLLVEACEPVSSAAEATAQGMGNVLSGRMSACDVSQTLGSWVQGGGGGGAAAAAGGTDGRASPLPLAAAMSGLQRLASKTRSDAATPTAAAAAAARAAADGADLVLEPTMAVAAEALAAAVDSALNSDTGEVLQFDSGIASFGGSGGAGGGGGGRGLRANLPLPSMLPASPAPAPLAPAPRSPFSTFRLPEAAAAATSSAAAGVAAGAAQPPPSLLHRTASIGSLMQSPAAAAAAAAAASEQSRLSYERPALGHRSPPPRAAGPSANSGTNSVAGGHMPSSGGGAGSGGGGVNHVSGRRVGGATGPTGPTGPTVDVVNTGAGGLLSPRDAGDKDPWVRPQVGKRPATATGATAAATAATSVFMQRSSAQFFSRETSPPGASGGASGSGSGAGAGVLPSLSSGGGSGGWSLAVAAVHHSGLYAASGSRQRPATAHGLTTATAGRAASTSAAAAAAALRAASSAAAPAAVPALHKSPSMSTAEGAAPPGAAAAAAACVGDDVSCRGPITGTPTRNNPTHRLFSRKSFSYFSAQRHVGGAGGPGGAGGGGVGAGATTSTGGSTPFSNSQTHPGHVPGVLLTSGSGMGGVSIISQGWSNLYDPLCPRPRLSDHYASGDFDEFGGSGGARTPGSLMSPSLGSAVQHWEYCSQPSLTLLTPAHSSNAGAPTATTVGAAAAATTTAADGVVAAAVAAAQPQPVGARGGGGGAQRPALHPSQDQTLSTAAAAGGTADGRNGGRGGGGGGGGGVTTAAVAGGAGGGEGGFDPMFGEMSGVISGHDIAYGSGDGGDRQLAVTAAAAAAITAQQLARSRSLDVGWSGGGVVVAGDSAYSSVYGNSLYGLPASGEAPKPQLRLPAAAVAAVVASTGGGSSRAATVPQSQARSPGSLGRSLDYGYGSPYAFAAAAAPAAEGTPAVEAGLLGGLAALRRVGGVGVGGLCQRVVPDVSQTQLSPEASSSGAVHSPTAGPGGAAGAAARPCTAGAASVPASAAGLLYSRRHSVDVVQRPALVPAAAATAAADATGGRGGPPGSATPFNRWYVAADNAAARPSVQTRGSADQPRRLGPGPFGSPIGALGPAAAAAAAAAAATGQVDGSGGGGGLDIARMLARASELVVLTQSNYSGGGASIDGRPSPAAGGGGTPAHPRGAAAAAEPQREPAPAAGPVPGSGVGGSSAGVAAPATAESAAAAATAADASADAAEEAAEATNAADAAVGLSYSATAGDPHYHHHHPLYHHHHHLLPHHGHHQALPYGLNPAVLVTRLDPVDEGCGSSTAASASSSSLATAAANNNADSSVQNALAGLRVGSAAAADAPMVFRTASATATQRHSADSHVHHHRTPLLPGASSPMAAAAAAAAASGAGASLSSSGLGYRGGGGGGASASSASTSPAATPHQARGASARWDAAVTPASGGAATGSGADAAAAATAAPLPPLASKRSFKSMLKKVKKALRGGSGGGDSGSGGAAHRL
ncbi:hypothetical protein PLESTB_001770200 [Pleodorina starrii]|uniref:Guanylate cyclase n=1 Tax=Pleodorina starrii TaxID=330485 RepID=A0A9W6C0J1_9CHLO|nr:hypothetical protein PLESTB_001770200 [Pleodorina starrii]